MKKILAFFILLTGCGKWDIPDFKKTSENELITNSALGDFVTVAGGVPHVVANDIVVSGRVVSSDRAGNFFNTFFIDDGTGAVEIMAGMYDLDATYHPGQLVMVYARGLAIGFRDGVMQLGRIPEPWSGYQTDYFSHPAVICKHVLPLRDVAPVAPLEVTLGQLDTKLCGRLVRISGLSLDQTQESSTWAITTPEPANGYVKFRSNPSDSIMVATSGYARFASSPVPHPTEKVALTGVLLHGKGDGSRNHFMLKLRDLNDVDVIHMNGQQTRLRMEGSRL